MPFIIACLLFCLALPVHAAQPVELVVEGVEGPALDNVRLALALPPGLVHEGKANRLWLQRFSGQADEKVRAALEPFGYYNANVTVVMEPLEKERYRLRVAVVPGEPVRVADVQVELHGSGSGQSSLQGLAAAFPLQKGSILLQQEYEKAKAVFKTRAEALGYLDADFPQHEIRIAPGETSARIKLVMETGERYLFNGTRIEGAPDYPEPFLKRYISFAPGDVFSYASLGETQLNLTNSERFKEVVVLPEKAEATDFRVPVLVQLKQAPRRTLRPGVGYGTDTGARFSLRYRDLNMFHKGHELNAQLYVAERLQGLAAGYIVPDYRDIRSSTTFQLNLQQEDVTAYISRLVAVEVARNHSFGKGELGTVYLRVQQEDFTIGTQESSSRLVLPGIRFSKDSYDNLIHPTSGFRFSVDVRGTHQFIGSDTSLLQCIGEGSHLLPLPWRLSLHSRVRVGTTLFSDPLVDIPPTLRFFAGGDQSVRGYSYKSLGPTDSSGKVAGGKQLLTGSIELERALFQNWGISAFHDAGNAFNTLSDVTLFQGAGIGLHYYSQVGAINLSVARQIGVDHPGYRIHFTVGFQL
ncbi:autotransporter assembly complex protein TamA [Pelotalea chapellei]|uniref:autotransporter assembly complex protein TamA n=1 Tax=Pelotalea chapellei TaxID=44671 RepID=UPI001FEC6908|nr:autotransporter assembly complex family protein [Pelotalea chapellei]